MHLGIALKKKKKKKNLPREINKIELLGTSKEKTLGEVSWEEKQYLSFHCYIPGIFIVLFYL